jgi:hypothetical protein
MHWKELPPRSSNDVNASHSLQHRLSLLACFPSRRARRYRNEIGGGRLTIITVAVLLAPSTDRPSEGARASRRSKGEICHRPLGVASQPRRQHPRRHEHEHEQRTHGGRVTLVGGTGESNKGHAPCNDPHSAGRGQRWAFTITMAISGRFHSTDLLATVPFPASRWRCACSASPRRTTHLPKGAADGGPPGSCRSGQPLRYCLGSSYPSCIGRVVHSSPPTPASAGGSERTAPRSAPPYRTPVTGPLTLAARAAGRVLVRSG